MTGQHGKNLITNIYMGNEKYGIHGLGDISSLTAFNKFKDGMQGFRFRKEASGYETARGVFDDDFWLDSIMLAIDAGKYVTIASMPGPGDNTQPYIFGAPDLVPKITTDRDVYAHGSNANYRARLKNLWANLTGLIAALPAEDEAFVICMQSAELSTGDTGTTKGTITEVTINNVKQSNPSSFAIDEADWTTIKRTDLWPYLDGLLKSNIPAVKIMINVGNNGENFEWVITNLPGAWIKIGYPAHNYNIPGEKYQQQMCFELRNAGPNDNRIQAEFEGTNTFAWFQKAPKKNLRTVIVSAIAHGLDIVNIALTKMESIFGSDISLMVWANRYLGYRNASETNQGFIVFRKMIDIWTETTIAPPVANDRLSNYNRQVTNIQARGYGDIQENWTIAGVKIDYINPAIVAELKLKYPSALYLTPDQDQDHNAYENDYGVDLIPGSYEKFVSIIDQDETTVPYWRVGPVDSYYGRFGIGFSSTKTKIFLTTELTTAGNFQVSILVRYLDKGTSTFSLRYNNGTADAIAGLATCSNSNNWVEKIFPVSNFNGAAAMERDAKFILQHESGDYLVIFDGVEFTRIASNEIPNAAPIPDAGTDQTITLPTTTVNLTGSATDSDGSVAGYLWQKLDGPACTIVSPTNQNTAVTGLSAGEYIFQLTATDNLGLSASDTVTISVKVASSNIEPVANAGGNETITLPTSQVSRTLSASTDADGTIVAWLWTQKDGPITGNIQSPTSESTIISGLTEPGEYVFRGRVEDNDGNRKGQSFTVTVLAPNFPPIVQITTPDAAIALPVNSVDVTASVSDGEGSVESIAWAQIKGSGATITAPTSANTSFEDLAEGVNTFRLTAIDDGGLVTYADFTVVVSRPEQEEDYLLNSTITDLTKYELDGGIKSLGEIPFRVNADALTDGKINATFTIQYVDTGLETFNLNCIRCANRKRRILSVKKTNTGNVLTASVSVSNFRATQTLVSGSDFTIDGALGTVYKLISFVNNDKPIQEA